MDAILLERSTFFIPDQVILACTPLGDGKINDTWLVKLQDGPSKVLQRLRKAVFPEPEAIIHNLRLISSHLKCSHTDVGTISFLTLCKNPAGADFLIDGEGNCWRMLSYINNSRTINTLSSTDQATELGRLLATFHTLVAKLNPTDLFDPLPGFHQPSHYLRIFDRVATRFTPKQEEEQSCLSFIEQFRDYALLLERNAHMLGAQVIHADPKVSNFLFAAGSNRAISLIDLDTVKHGLLLHDLGDCLRSCCNLLGEESVDPAQVAFDTRYFTAFLAGYAEKGKHHLSASDTYYLVDAIKIISFELGLRFFTDHISGNIYWKCDFPGQNLHRALIQFSLTKSIDRQRLQMERMVASFF